MIGYRHEVQSFPPPNRLSQIVNNLTFGKTIGIIRIDSGSESDICVKRIARVEMEITIIGIAQRI
jgi:hypothetical protein